MKHGSLFSGIGGFDLAAEWMGWENVFHCEIEEFPRHILKHYWPNSKLYEDIKTTDFTVHRGQIDVLTGGFPCQPYSHAGMRLGTEDDRHLWPEMLRAVREISPRWVVGENVRGIINWNDGLVFDEVQTDLEAIGYEVLPFLLPAAGVNAPHERYRIFFVAHASNTGLKGVRESKTTTDRLKLIADSASKRPQAREQLGIDQDTKKNSTGMDDRLERSCNIRNASDANDKRLQRGADYRSTLSCRKREKKQSSGLFSPNWDEFPTQPPLFAGNDGFPSELVRRRIREDSLGILSEKEIDKIISNATSKIRRETIKAAGNAVVVPLVLQIFKAIQKYEESIKTNRGLSKVTNS